ncbi:MAG: hypothetical protein HZA13_08010 [Nitrospirae bacterium]|nr:hypothetical protein [Nitrospirota bacterium]
MLKRILVCLIVISLGTTISSVSFAEDNAMREVFRDGFYGGLAGALVGGAILAFKDEPGDHLNYIAYGAAGGVLVGTIYGLASVSRAFAEVENGKVYVNLPLPHTGISRIGIDRYEVNYSLSLLRYNF